VILIGQLVAVVTGPATSLLVMIGEVGKYKAVMFISLASQLLLIPFGAYIGGLIYAAIAVALCYGFQNIAAYWLAMRCLNNMKC
jgi:O-antigen/teichoic acid export membrane protein